jgi:hypothetical protein
VISRHSSAICSRACIVCLAILEMAVIHEQRINIKFCFILWETFTETRDMMKNVYGDQCMSRTLCYERFNRFKNGRQSTHDEPRSVRSSASCDDAHVARVSDIFIIRWFQTSISMFSYFSLFVRIF